MGTLKHAIEALLIVSDRPISIGAIKEAIPDAQPQDIESALNELKSEYDTGHAFSLEAVAGGYQLLTRSEYDDTIAKLKKIEARKRLSRAALETLSIIAYKQPIKRADIESIRGVSSLDIIKGLMEMGLVAITGREDAPGAPLLYGTTPKFLEVFGLKSLEELPKPEELK